MKVETKENLKNYIKFLIQEIERLELENNILKNKIKKT